MQAAKERKISMVLHKEGPHMLRCWHDRHTVPTGARVAQMWG